MTTAVVMWLATAVVMTAPSRADDAAARAAASAAAEAAEARTSAFERELFVPAAKGAARRFTPRPAAEQRPIVASFFATVKTPADKVAFLHVGFSRYVYAIDREVYGEYAAGLLADPDTVVRRDAVKGVTYNRLQQYGASVEKLLDDPDAEVRQRALTGLAWFGRHDVAPRMAEVARSADVSEGDRVAAVAAVGVLMRDAKATPEQREREVALIVEHLAPDAAVAMRQAALGVIAMGPTPQDAPRFADAVLKLAAAPEPEVRASAVAALRLFEGDAAAAAIRAALADPSESVRGAAARAAGERKDAGATAGLVRLLNDEAPWVRAATIGAITAIGQAASDDAAAVAARLGDPNPSVRKAAAQALGELQATRHAAEVAALLSDKDEYVRMHAARALGTIGTRDQVAAVAAATQDPAFLVRLWALRALGHLDARDRRPTVESLTADKETMVVEEAKALLAKWDRK